MNKIMKTSLLLGAVATLGMMNTSAKTMTAKDIEEISKYAIEGTTEKQQDNIYILGKHVHFTMFTFADSMSVINTNDFDGDLKDAVLYRKDTKGAWTDAAYNKAISTSDAAKLEFEMVRLIGEKGTNGHTSEDTDLYTSNGEFITTVTPSVGRTYDEFVDATKDLMAVSIRPLQKAANLGNVEYTDSNAYNISALNAELTHEQIRGETVYTLSLTENSPLLSYNRNSKGDAKWIGLLVRTNKLIDPKKNLEVKLDNKTTDIQVDTTEEAKEANGGEMTEFVLWVKADKLNENSKLTIQQTSTKTEETEKEQPINVVFNHTAELDHSRVVKEDNLDVKILNNENVKVVAPKINGKYIEIFYTENKLTGGKEVKDFKFTENENLMQAVKNPTWKYADLIEVKSAEAVKASSSSEWNQNAITNVTVAEHTRTDKEKYDYVVTITTDHILKNNKDVKLLLDLSTTDIGITDETSKVTKNSVIDGKIEVIANFDSTNEVVASISNNNSGLSSKITDTYDVLFVLNDETTPLSFNAYGASQTADLVYGNTVNGDTVNAAYKHNVAAATVNAPVVDKENKNNYTVKVQVNSQLEKFKISGLNVNLDDSSGDGDTWIPVIVDLGFKLELTNVEQKITEDNFTVTASPSYTKTYAVAKSDIEDAKRLGATSDTAFIIWVKPSITENGQSFTFTKVDSNASITVKFEVRESNNNLSDNTLTVKEVDNVVISSEYSSDVKYLGNKTFSVNKNVNQFVATINGVEYTYNIDWSSDVTNHNTGTLSRLENIVPKAAYKALQTTEELYNNAIEKVDYSNGTITVTFNRQVDPNKEYIIAVDLGMKLPQSGVTSFNDADAYLYDSSKYIKVGSDSSEVQLNTILSDDVINSIKDNNSIALIKVKPIDTDVNAEEDKVVELYYNVSNNATVSKNITIISKVVDTREDNLELQEETTTSLSLADDSFTGEHAEEARHNNEVISTKVVNGEIVISYNGKLISYKNDLDKDPSHSGGRSYFGVLVDLGVDPKTLGTLSGYVFNADLEEYGSSNPRNALGKVAHGLGDSKFDERTDAYKYGATSDTQFILWLDKECFEPEVIDGKETGRLTKTIEFVSAGNTENPNSKYKMTFVLEDNRELLETPNVKVPTENKDLTGTNLELFGLNQTKATVSFEENEIAEDGTKSANVSITYEDLVEFASYQRPNKSSTYKWFVLDIDFGKNVKVSETSDIKIVEFENSTVKRFYIDMATATTKPEFVFTDDYTGDTYKLIFNIEKVKTE